MKDSFRPSRPLGIPWLGWRGRLHAGEGARTTRLPRVLVETLAPPVLREKPLERKRLPDEFCLRAFSIASTKVSMLWTADSSLVLAFGCGRLGM
jgi:hypothetical protein